jgi:YYY domain-containing protein
MLAALGLLALVEAVGLAALPLTALVLGRLPGAGLGLTKVLGVLVVTWLVWLLPALGIAAYGPGLIAGVLAALGLAGLAAGVQLRRLGARARREPEGGRLARWRARRARRLALPPDPDRRRLLVASEAVFALAYAAGCLLASLAPDVWNTEKPMDMAFIDAVNAATSFPPHDPWMSGEDLNYYYLGHVALAWPARLLGLAPDEGYLLGWGLLLGLSATAVFTVAAALWAAARRALGERAPRGGPVAAGLLAVALCLVLGNLAGVRAWLDAAHPPGDFDWYAPSRVIPGTINEFPAFSFVLGDLHAHVLAIPFTALALAFALQVALTGPRGDLALRAVAEGLAAGLAVGILYAVNAWSFPVGAGLLVAGTVLWVRDRASAGRRGYALSWLALVLAASVVLLLPFWLRFDPAADGVASVPERRRFLAFLGDQALIYGLLAWPLVAAYAGRLLRARHPWRVAIWGLVALLVAGTALSGPHLAGTLLLAVAAAVALHAALAAGPLAAPERFLWVLVAGAAALLAVPEVIYLRDAFDNSALYRMNTVFKLGYQAYLLAGIAAACALPWAPAWLPRIAWQAWAGAAAVALLLGAVYPWGAADARTGGLTPGPSLDGLAWLRQRAPGDPDAIAWLRAHTPGDAVVLEATGQDYAPTGEGRISTFTGRPTVLGWAGHELQWAHDPGTRAADVRTLYATADLPQARALLARYGIAYVVAGPIERADYGEGGLAKWDALGRRVFSRAGTTIWRIRPAA